MRGAGLSSQLDKWTIIGAWRLSPAPGPGVAGGLLVPWAVFLLEVNHQLWASLLGCQPWLCLSPAMCPGHGI